MRADLRHLPVLVALLAPGLLVLAVLLAAPFVTILLASVLDKYPGATHNTLVHYRNFLLDSYYLHILFRTFALALVVTLICAVIGYPLSWYLAWGRPRWTHWVFLCVITPLLVSIVVRTLGWTIVLGNEGLINNTLLGAGLIAEPLPLMNNFWSVTLGMVHVLLPFMILSIASVLARSDRSLTEAAFTLGAQPVRAFMRVTLPLSIQGIATGSVIVFCLTVGAYVTPMWLGRGHVTLMAMTIYDQMIALVDWPAGAATSIVLTAGTLLLLLAYGLSTARFARR